MAQPVSLFRQTDKRTAVSSWLWRWTYYPGTH